MNEKLSIKQVQKNMGWSYPTALKFAASHGQQVEGKWFVPASAVEDEIEKMDNNLQSIKSEYTAVLQ